MSPPADSPEVHTVVDLLWRVETEGGGVRPTLNARVIVEAAVTLAAAEGLDAVSMQRVASELGYTPMALYRYVPGKAHLVAAMVDTATGAPPAPPDPARGWRAEIESWVDAVWTLYRRHPWLLRAPTPRAPVGPNELAWFEALLRPLSRAALRRDELVPIATFVSSAVRDLARVATDLDPAEAAAYQDVLVRRLDPERFSVLHGLVVDNVFDDEDNADVTPIVHYGLRRLLDGIESTVRARPTGKKDN